MSTRKYMLVDASSYSEMIEADSLADAREQAVEWAQGVCWGGETRTVMVRIFSLTGDGEAGDLLDSVDVPVGDDPEPPACADGHAHDWAAPGWGCRENPGVVADGARIVSVCACKHCGVQRYTCIDTTGRIPDCVEYR